MYKVTKTFHLAYGHRLFNYNGKCENLHGHNGKVEVTLQSKKLNKETMVMDFTELGRKIKKWIDSNLDHKVILAKKDTLVPILKKHGQDYFLTKDNPTAEALAKLVFETASRMKMPVCEVTFWETPTSMASYSK